MDKTNLAISLFNQDCGLWLLSILKNVYDLLIQLSHKLKSLGATVRTGLTINPGKDRVTI